MSEFATRLDLWVIAGNGVRLSADECLEQHFGYWARGYAAGTAGGGLFGLFLLAWLSPQ